MRACGRVGGRQRLVVTGVMWVVAVQGEGGGASKGCWEVRSRVAAPAPCTAHLGSDAGALVAIRAVFRCARNRSWISVWEVVRVACVSVCHLCVCVSVLCEGFCVHVSCATGEIYFSVLCLRFCVM